MSGISPVFGFNKLVASFLQLLTVLHSGQRYAINMNKLRCQPFHPLFA